VVQILTTTDVVSTMTMVVPKCATRCHTEDVPKPQTSSHLGDRLRGLRESQGWSLREVATKAGVNHGYLSQLERGDVAEPAPSMLHKVAAGYDVPFHVLMQWAGYVETAEDDLSPNQAIALKLLGDDVSEQELDAIRAVIEVLRGRRSTLGPGDQLDGALSPTERKTIETHALALLRRSDALGVFPTPLERLMEVAELVAAGEITLDVDEKKKLRASFGSLLDKALDLLQGAIHRRSREVWIQPDLHEMRRRFVLAHEIGHDVLPWQRELAYLDNAQRLSENVRIRFEREANQAAIELLAQGDALRQEADDSPLTVSLLSSLSGKYAISLQATARRITEESRKDAAMTIRFRGKAGGIGPYHVYCSRSFESRFGWATTVLPADARTAARESADTGSPINFLAADLATAFTEVAVETVTTPYAQISLYTPVSKSRSLRRFLQVG
jgi:transcriptional regulator with XRE-family HTH domain